VKNDSLGIPLLSSVAIHICLILLGSVIFHGENLRRQDFLPIALVDLPRPPAPLLPLEVEAPPVIKKRPPPPPPKKLEKPKERPRVAKAPVVKREPPAPLPPAPVKQEPPEVAEMNPTEPANVESPPSLVSSARVKGAAAKQAPGLYSVRETWAWCPEPKRTVEAAARPLPAWDATPARLDCRRRASCEPTVKPNRCKPSGPTIR